MQSDPIGLRAGTNTYGYVGGNPLYWIDFLGLTEGSPSNLAKRKKIDELARGYDGSKDWRFNTRKDNFLNPSNKCNKFVYDVTKEAGAEALTQATDGNMRPPLASEWAHDTNIPNWRRLKKGEKPQPGDVGAYKRSDGGTSFSGHTGIITSCECEGGGTSNMSAHDDAVYPTPGQFLNHPNAIFRRYIGD